MRIKIMVMAAALALAILSLVGIVAASAGVKRFESRIRVISATTDYSDTFGYLTYIDGKVKSRKPACRRKRRVTVNGFYHGKWQHLPGWRTTTDSDGGWEFQSQQNGIVAASKLRVKVLRRRLANGNVCLGDASKAFEATQKR